MTENVTARAIDFSNVKEGGSFNKRRVPAGDYLARVVKVQDAEVKSGENKGSFQYLWTISLENAKYGSGKYPYYTPIVENQLWKLRNILVAAGKNVPKSRTKVDPTTIVNKLVGVTMEDDEYEGKDQSVIAAIFPAAELAEGPLADEGTGDDDSDEPEVAGGDDEEVEVDEPEEAGEVEDPLATMDRAELKAEIKQLDDGATFKKSESDDDLRNRLRTLQQPSPQKVEDDDLEELDIDDEV